MRATERHTGAILSLDFSQLECSQRRQQSPVSGPLRPLKCFPTYCELSITHSSMTLMEQPNFSWPRPTPSFWMICSQVHPAVSSRV